MSYLPCDYYFVYIKQVKFLLKGSFEVFKKNNQILHMKIDWWWKTSFTFTKIYFPFILVYRNFFCAFIKDLCDVTVYFMCCLQQYTILKNANYGDFHSLLVIWQLSHTLLIYIRKPSIATFKTTLF